jgi:hypothetical protein
MATKTRFDEIRFHQPFPGVWRFVDAEDRDVGPQYATRAELLADLERYAAEYGCVGAVDVNATLRARVAKLEEALRATLYALQSECATRGDAWIARASGDDWTDEINAASAALDRK